MSVDLNLRGAGPSLAESGNHSRTLCILMDGGFVLHRLKPSTTRLPSASRVISFLDEIAARVRSFRVLRTSFYYCEPATDPLRNPLSKEELTLGNTDEARRTRSLLEELKRADGFRVWLGEVQVRGWLIRERAYPHLLDGAPMREKDLKPNITQKGVDVKLAMDVAQLSLTGKIDAIAVVTNDADFIPALEFARDRAIEVIVVGMGQRPQSRLAAHADRVVVIDAPDRARRTDEKRDRAEALMPGGSGPFSPPPRESENVDGNGRTGTRSRT